MTPPIASHIFRAYDIRGIVGEGLRPEVMRLLGRAIGSEALDLGESRLVLGADARLSSPGFRRAMRDGLLASGCDVIDIGTVPTPLLYFATHVLDAASGVMITGSHNPKDYNGVKIVLRRQCLADNQIRGLRDRILDRRLHEGAGRIERAAVEESYIDRIRGDLCLRPGMKVAIDCGNGVTGALAPRLFQALGCEVLPLYCEVDGNFPHHHPDPTVADNLRDLAALVRASGAELGIAFDGDGDRLGLVTAAGRVIDADRMMMCFIRDILPDNPGARVVFDVKSSSHLARLVGEAGGVPVLCRSGHSYVKRCMQESGALLGGEFSAHLFFGHRWYGFDDGLYAAARFLELMARLEISADALLDSLPASSSTPELFLPVEEERKFELMARLQDALRFEGADINTLDGLRADFPAGWGLLRPSNTTPNLVLRFEADTPRDLAEIQELFRSQILAVDSSLALPF